MKVYAGKTIVMDYTRDNLVLSFADKHEGTQVSVVVPRELLGAARHTVASRPAVVLVDDDLGLVGLSQPDDGLVDEFADE